MLAYVLRSTKYSFDRNRRGVIGSRRWFYFSFGYIKAQMISRH